MSPVIDLTPQSTQILNSLSGLAGGIAEGGEAAAHIRAQQAAQSLAAQAQALHAQAVQADMARAQRQEDLANQQRGAAQDAIGILTEQSGLPPTVAGVLRRMEPQHAAVAFKEFQTEGARRTLQGQIEGALSNPLGVTADIGPDGTPIPNPERQQQFKGWAEELKNGADPTAIAQQYHAVTGEEIGKRSQSNVINFHIEAYGKRLAQAVGNGVDPHEGSTLMEAAKADPSYFEDPAHKHAFDVAVTTGNAIASDGSQHPPRELQQYESMLSENAALKQMIQKSEAEKNQAQALKDRAEASAVPTNADSKATGEQAKLMREKRLQNNPPGSATPPMKMNEALDQARKVLDARVANDSSYKYADHDLYTVAQNLMALDRKVRTGQISPEQAQAQVQSEATPEAKNAAGAGEASKLASPELRAADLREHPEKYQWIGGDVEKTKAWIKEGKRQ